MDLHLKKEQKEAIALLQIGTFLEYFDLMIYIHMAVLLNEIFFPKADPHTAAILAAFALCSTYILRPVGAIIFGYIGDIIGRKHTVVITTILMAMSCIFMAVLPTYNQIGIAAAWGVTLCRAVQSVSSQGEIIGAEIYLAETIQPPARYVAVSLTSFFSSLGGVAALMLAVSLKYLDISWRIAFWVGAFIALIGSSARIRLRETPEFVDMKLRIKKVIENSELGGKNQVFLSFKNTTHPLWKEKVSLKTALAYFLISCGFPACFYLAYIYCGHILKNNFDYTSDQIMKQNLIVSIFQSLSFLIYSLCSHKINPLKILNFRIYLFLPFVIICPYLLNNFTSVNEILIFQCFIMVFGVMDCPGAGIFISHFPVSKRFTSLGLMYAFSRIIIYIITSFGFVYLTKWFSNFGVFFIMILITIGFIWGVKHFKELENNIPKIFRNSI